MLQSFRSAFLFLRVLTVDLILLLMIISITVYGLVLYLGAIGGAW